MIFGVYRFMSMAIATCNTIGNSVATVVIAKWSKTFDATVARRHLYPEQFPDTAREDAALDDGTAMIGIERATPSHAGMATTR